MKITMGEKIKDMRVERHLTTKQLAQQTGISEAVLNGIENDSGRDVGYSRIIELAKFFEVPTDYLLGFTESRITKNIELEAEGWVVLRFWGNDIKKHLTECADKIEQAVRENE